MLLPCVENAMLPKNRNLPTKKQRMNLISKLDIDAASIELQSLEKKLLYISIERKNKFLKVCIMFLFCVHSFNGRIKHGLQLDK